MILKCSVIGHGWGLAENKTFTPPGLTLFSGDSTILSFSHLCRVLSYNRLQRYYKYVILYITIALHLPSII